MSNSNVQAIFEDIRNRVIGIKENTNISNLVIVPTLFDISVRLAVQCRGLSTTLDALAATLAAAERDYGIPATAIIEIKLPIQPPHHRAIVNVTLRHLVCDLNAKGHSAVDMAEAFGAFALQLADKAADKWFAVAVVKDTLEKLRREPTNVPSASLPDMFLAALKANSENESSSGSEIEQQSERMMSKVDRELLEWELSVKNLVARLFEDRGAFRLLAAAVFALQQDMRKALRVDLWKIDDIIQGTIDDRIPPPPPGGLKFQDRCVKSMEILSGIRKINQDLCDNPPDRPDTGPLVFASTLRANAASIWLLTVMAKIQESTNLKLTMMNIWLRLGMVPADELIEPAKMFSGTYFNDISSEQFVLDAWPRVNDPNVFVESLIR